MTYASWLLNMGNGKLWGPFSDLIEVPQQMVCNSTRELEDKVFDDFEDNMKDVNYLCQRAIMSTKNDIINGRKKIKLLLLVTMLSVFQILNILLLTTMATVYCLLKTLMLIIIVVQ